MKQVRPILLKILSTYDQIDKLSNDELRSRSEALRVRLRECERPFEERIEAIRAQMEQDIAVSEKEKLGKESEKLVKDEDEAIEECLAEVLPEAFAIMKSTALRFAQNETIEVTATQFDRDLSINHDFVSIEGDKAIYRNHWQARIPAQYMPWWEENVEKLRQEYISSHLGAKN